MPASIFTQTRVRLTCIFSRAGVALDPQIVMYDSSFAPSTVGAAVEEESYTYGLTSDIVRTDVGSYYVEILADVPGRIKFTWRSTAWGEEVVQEEIVNVVARTIAV